MADKEVFPGLSQPSGDLHLSLHTHGATNTKLMANHKIGSAPAGSNNLTSKPQEHTRGNACAHMCLAKVAMVEFTHPAAGVARQTG